MTEVELEVLERIDMGFKHMAKKLLTSIAFPIQMVRYEANLVQEDLTKF